MASRPEVPDRDDTAEVETFDEAVERIRRQLAAVVLTSTPGPADGGLRSRP